MGTIAHLFRPRRPQLTTKSVCDEEDTLADSSCLTGNLELLLQTGDRIGIDGSVVVHGGLNDEDNGNDSPFLPSWKGEACLSPRFLLSKLMFIFEVWVREFAMGSNALFVLTAVTAIGSVCGGRFSVGHAWGFVRCIVARLLSNVNNCEFSFKETL